MVGGKSTLLESGGDLLSRAVSSQVPSALKGLTSVFGMGTGGTPSPLPPETVASLVAWPALSLAHAPRHQLLGWCRVANPQGLCALFAWPALTLAHAPRHQPVGRFRVANLSVRSFFRTLTAAHR